jgi:hypothetical protein
MLAVVEVEVLSILQPLVLEVLVVEQQVLLAETHHQELLILAVAVVAEAQLVEVTQVQEQAVLELLLFAMQTHCQI